MSAEYDKHNPPPHPPSRLTEADVDRLWLAVVKAIVAGLPRREVAGRVRKLARRAG